MRIQAAKRIKLCLGHHRTKTRNFLDGEALGGNEEIMNIALIGGSILLTILVLLIILLVILAIPVSIVLGIVYYVTKHKTLEQEWRDSTQSQSYTQLDIKQKSEDNTGE